MQDGQERLPSGFIGFLCAKTSAYWVFGLLTVLAVAFFPEWFDLAAAMVARQFPQSSFELVLAKPFYFLLGYVIIVCGLGAWKNPHWGKKIMCAGLAWFALSFWVHTDEWLMIVVESIRPYFSSVHRTHIIFGVLLLPLIVALTWCYRLFSKVLTTAVIAFSRGAPQE